MCASAWQPARYCRGTTYTIECDASAASYFLAAPAILGGTVRVANFSRRSRQGDVAFVDVLAQMGCVAVETNDALAVTGPAPRQLQGVEVDMRHIPDTAQTLAAIAPFANSPTVIHGIASARVKETDRVAAMCAELRRLGVTVEEYPDGLKIYPAEQLAPGPSGPMTTIAWPWPLRWPACAATACRSRILAVSPKPFQTILRCSTVCGRDDHACGGTSAPWKADLRELA